MVPGSELRANDRSSVLPFLLPISPPCQLPTTLRPSLTKQTVKCALVDMGYPLQPRPCLVGAQVRQLPYPPPRNRHSRTCYRTFSKSPQAPFQRLCGCLNVAAVNPSATTGRLAATAPRSSGGDMGDSGASGSRVSWADVLCTGSGTEDNR